MVTGNYMNKQERAEFEVEYEEKQLGKLLIRKNEIIRTLIKEESELGALVNQIKSMRQHLDEKWMKN